METQEEKRKKRSQRNYSLGFKLQVVSEVEKGELSYKQAQKKYGIQGRSTVLVWIRKHSILDWKELPVVSHKKTPEQKIKELQTLLAIEKEKVHVLNVAIDIADDMPKNGYQKKVFTQTIKKAVVPIKGIKGISVLLGLSRQSYYKSKTSRVKRNADLLIVRDVVMRIRCSMPRIGTRKLYYLIKNELTELNIKIGRDVLFNFLRAEHLLIIKEKLCKNN